MDWRNKVALITGASSGIGRGLAFALARRGAAVGLLARREHVLQSVVLEIEAEGGRAISLPADVRDAEAMRSASGALHDRFGPVDLLVANAGIGATTYAVDLCEKAVADLINVNVIGVVNSVTGVIPQMVERGSGHLVEMSSLAAYRGLPKSAAYCASKVATSARFEGLRIALLGTGVDVTIIHPGFIKTPLTVGVKRMPYLMELDEAVPKILRAIEKRRKGYSFPWQLASIARACMLLPNPLYDWFAIRNSFRE